MNLFSVASAPAPPFVAADATRGGRSNDMQSALRGRLLAFRENSPRGGGGGGGRGSVAREVFLDSVAMSTKVRSLQVVL